MSVIARAELEGHPWRVEIICVSRLRLDARCEIVELRIKTTCSFRRVLVLTCLLSDEEVTTIPSQVVFEVTVTESEPTSTLFSLCPTDNPSGISSPPIITSSGSVVLSASQASSTFPNGSVAVSWVTYTSTLPPTWVTAPPPTNGPDGNGSSNAPDDLGPIIGGALGGFVGFTVLAVLAWFIWCVLRGSPLPSRVTLLPSQAEAGHVPQHISQRSRSKL